ncbi:MAG TPA: pyruvate formate lyase family protein [Armatimonadota bacterium]|nr:pyruvate formate lyase family protein [Armatimonadota bacterium]
MAQVSDRTTTRREAIRDRALSLESSIPRGVRLALVTESYQQTEGQPEIIRRAVALSHYLRSLPIHIFPEDRMVGLPQGRAVTHQGLSEHDRDWWVAADYPEYRFPAHAAEHEDTPEQARRDIEWWREHRVTHPDPLNDSPRAGAIRAAHSAGLFVASGSPIGHALPGHWWILQVGLGHVATDAAARARAAEDPDRRDTWQAMAIAAEAGIAYAERYAALARDLAADADDPVRRAELIAIAGACEWTPRNPPRNFREALQCIWLVHRVEEMEQGDGQPTTHCFGRLDQLLFPYLERDLAAGEMTREDAKERLRELYLKLYRYYTDQHIMLGGMGPDGGDATNDISRMMLEIAAEERLLIDLGVRVHAGTPDWFWRQVAEVSALNLGLSVFGDEAIIPGLERLDIETRWARDYSIVGCVETVIAGYTPPRTLEHSLSPLKCVELALNDGRCALTGGQIGPRTGDPSNFGDMAAVWDAFSEQMRAAVDLCVEATIVGERRNLATVWLPFQSCTYPDALEKGIEVTHGGAARNVAGVAMVCVANAADSLAAIEHAVFAQRLVSMAELVAALRADFEGHEPLRQRLLRAAPKYGNGIEAADKWARRIVELYASELGRYRNFFGEPWLPMVFGMPVGSTLTFASRTAATPDGRHAGDPIAKGMAPVPGADRSGLTATLRSIAACDHSLLCGGTTCVVDVHSSALAGEDGAEKLAHLLRTFFAMGASNIGINAISAEALREARCDPASYRSLSVRIFGYSDYFVNLDADIQDYLIERAGHGQA